MAKNTIKIKNYLNIFEERVANAAITPGHLIEYMSTGKVRKHATAGGEVTPVAFAIEDELQGNGITDNYSASNVVQCWIPQRGDHVYAILADGENAAIGSKLESAGDGTLQVYVADSGAVTNTNNQIVGIALEALDLRSSSGAESTYRIEIMVV